MKAKELYTLIEKHLINDKKPSIHLNHLINETLFSKYPFTMLSELKSTKQSPKYHPEGDVWNHTLMVVDEAAKVKEKSKDQKVFMWAAFLHDIGKPSTTKYRRGKITSYDHDKVGAKLAKEFLENFTEDQSFIDDVVGLVKYHMQILYVVKDMPYAEIKGMKSESNIEEIALLGLCDRLGRLRADKQKEQNTIETFQLKVTETLV